MIHIYLIFLTYIQIIFSLEFIKADDLKTKNYLETNNKIKLRFTQESEITLYPQEDHKISDLSNKELYFYKIIIQQTNKKYVIFKTKTKKYEEYCRLELLLNYNNRATPYNYDFASNLYLHNNIGLDIKNDIKDRKEFYISVNAPIKNCDGYLEYYLSDDIDLDPNDHFEFIGGGEKKIYYISIKKFYWSMLQLILLTPQTDFYNFKIGYFKKNDKNENEFEYKEACFPNYLINDIDFFTDCSYILRLAKVEDYPKIIIELSGSENTFMRFTTRKIDDPIYRIGEPAFYSIKAKETEIIMQDECVLLENVKKDRKYQLRVVNTEELEMTFRDHTIKFDYLSNHYQIFNEGEIQNNDYICFHSLPKTNKINRKGNIEEKVTEKQAFYFQIIEQNPKYSIYSVIEPLYEGNKYYDIIPSKGQRFYRHAKKSDLKTHLTIVVKEGMISAKVGQCNNFPNCKFDDELTNYDENTISNLIFAFGAFVTYLDPNDNYNGTHNQYVTIVQCESNIDCLFSLEYSDETKSLFLEENQNFAKYIPENKTDKYSIYLKKNKIEFNFDVFSGNAIVNFQYSGNIKYTIEKIRYGNSKKYIVYIPNDDLGNIEANVNAISNSYYLISYRYIDSTNSVSLKDSGFVLQYLDNESKKKIFKFKHNIKNPDIGIFHMNVIPLNCEIKVDFINDHKEIYPSKYSGIYEHNIHDESYFDTLLEYHIELKSFFNKERQKRCYFYIGSSESTKTVPYFIRESYPFSFTLSNERKNVYFVFPYSVYEGNSIIIKINIEIEAFIQISYHINSEKPVNYITSKSMTLEIGYYSTLTICQDKVICSIFLDFSAMDTNIKQDIPITFSINSGRVSSSVLTKGYLRRESVACNRISYFSMEVFPNEEGEIVLDMKKGSGTIYAKIYNGNSDFNLPTDKDNGLIKFDSLNQKLVYSNAQFNDCTENCILYLGVSSKDKYGDDDNLFFFDFNIYVRNIYKDFKNLNKSIVQIYINEFISGSLTKTIDENKYYDVYSLYILEELEGIDIEFYSLSTSLYIKFDSDEIPTANNTKCHILPSGKDQILKIKKNSDNNNCKIPNSIKDKKFLISIGTNKFENGKNSPYVFRVRPIRSNSINIIEVDSDKETTCKIEQENGFCYFLVPINSYDAISELLAYSFSEGVSELTMYANIITSTSYHECKNNIECLKKYLPNENKYNKTSLKQFDKSYLLFDRILKITDLVLIGVKSNIKETISFTTSFKTYTKEGAPIPLFLQLIPLSYSNFKIKYTDEYNYIIALINIAGAGTIAVVSDTNVREDYMLSRNYMILFDTRATNGNIELEYVENNSHLVGIWYYIKNPDISINELRIGKYTKIYFQHSPPYGFYALINDKTEDYIFEFTINSIITDKSKNEKTKLEINSYIVNEETMNKLKVTKDFPINTLKKINGYFDDERLFGRVYIESRDFNEKNFIFTYIKSNSNIKINKLSGSVYLYPSRSPYEPSPQDSYISGTITSKQESKFLLKKNYEKEGNQFIVEISISNNENAFEFFDKNNQIIKNKIIIQSIGKKVYNITTEDDIIYLVIGKKNEYNNFDYSFKYVSGPLSIAPRRNSLSSDKIDIKLTNQKNKEIKVTIKGVKHDSNSNHNFTYFFQVYDLDKNQNLEKTHKISTNAILLKNYIYSNSVTSINSEINQTFKNIPEKAFIYVFAIDEISKEFFGYESIKYSFKEESNKSKKVPTIVIVICIIVFTAIFIGAIYKIKKILEERNALEQRINQLSVTISGTSIPEAQENLLGKNNFN